MVVLAIFIITLAACQDKKPGSATSNIAADSDQKLAEHLKPAEVKPIKPLDQSTPQGALLSFFEAINIALDPAFQVADKQPELEPARAKAYLESRTRLRSLIVSREGVNKVNPNTEILAYLDLIEIKRAEIVGEPKINGDKAIVKVKVIKGVGPNGDPRAFGEEPGTEVTVEVEMVRQAELWKIKDFGGLVAKAQAARQF